MLKNILIYISSFVGLFGFTYYLLSLLLLDKIEKKPKILRSKLPPVTIIIPAYNEEETIERTILSALEIDYPKNRFEIIMVDDGSTDNTYKLAKKIKDSRLKVLTKKNGGKASALNMGIKKSKGEIIFTMDADTYVEKNALPLMIDYFVNDPKVMCVTPSMVVHKPKGILQRVQQMEYLLGIFLRKAFATMGSVHVTPGAFSSYRKIFFERYGGFDEHNITEDMEMALRIQRYHHIIQCSDRSIAYTTVPRKFIDVWNQRKRWYYGWIYNFVKYKKLFSKDYGQMGTIVLPIAVTTIFLSIILTFFLVFNALQRLKHELDFLQGINFNFMSSFELSWFVIEKFFFLLFSNPIFLILILFIGIVTFYLFFAKNRVSKYSGSFLSMILFILLYSLLYTFWWLSGMFYYFVLKRITWGKK